MAVFVSVILRELRFSSLGSPGSQMTLTTSMIKTSADVNQSWKVSKTAFGALMKNNPPYYSQFFSQDFILYLILCR